MAVDLASVLNADSKLFLEVDKDVSNVLLRAGELVLRALALSCHIEGQSLLGASRVAEGSARVVIRALRLEGHAASDLRVGPDLPLQRLDRENLVLEEHRIVFDGLADPLVLALECGDGLLLCPLSLEPQFGLVVGVVAVEALFPTLVLILVLEHGPLFGLFLAQLHVEARLLLILLLLLCAQTPLPFPRCHDAS